MTKKNQYFLFKENELKKKMRENNQREAKVFNYI